MKKTTAVIFAVLVCVSVCSAQEGRVRYSMTSKTVTNEVSEEQYNIRTNGYAKVEEQGRHWANNIVYNYGNGQSTVLCSTVTNMAWTGWVSQNQSVHNPPDPFKEKVTIKYFTEELEEYYTLHVGPLDTDFATVKKVIKRWKTRHVQKLNMVESTEKVND